MTTRRPTAIDELVPLAERLRHLQVARLLIVAAFVAYLAVVPAARRVPLSEVAVVTAGYLAVSAVGHLAWHLRRARGITLFGALLIGDGFALAWMASVSGGTAGPIRYLTLVHLVAVALLASYRTAMKIALWHSMLAIGTLEAEKAGLFVGSSALSASLPGTPSEQLGAFLALAWAITLAAAAFAAVNERELRRRKVDMEDLARLATALERTTTRAEVARTLHDSLVAAYGFPRLTVLTVEGDVLVATGARGTDSRRLDSDAAGDSLRSAWRDRSTQLVTRLDGGLVGLMPGAQNVLLAPLSADGRALGAVVAEQGTRRGARIERRVVQMVERFCDHAALALRTAAVLEELQDAASTDGLTGVANRRTFEQTLAREQALAGRSGAPLSLVMVDIDHFKALNDNHGHPAGDAVLRAVAAGLVQACRAVDVVARYGGEEFAVVLPDCPKASAVEAAERLRLAVASLPLPTTVTASLGVATADSRSDSDDLVKSADAALYTAKRQGRNRVAVSGGNVAAQATR